MGTYEHILYPTDGSTGSEAVRDRIVDLASTYGATVHVLYVVEDETSGPKSTITAQTPIKKQRKAAGQDLVEETADELSSRDVDAVTEVRQGSPYRTILSYTDEKGVDMIVMPTHGRQGLDRYLLGSVTEKVVRSSEVPVLTIQVDEGS